MHAINGTDITPNANNPTSRKWERSVAAWAFPLYLSLVVYGSLIPFDVRDLTLTEAWQRFGNVPYLKLGVQSRADWIANILLYIPLSYFAAAWLQRHQLFRHGPILTGLSASFACVAIAVAIEFTQNFFAPRTVSLNDLIAEFIGTTLGIALYFATPRYFAPHWHRLALGGRRALIAALGFYTAAYLIFSIFPFDFLLSSEELAWKLTTGQVGFLFAPAFADSWLRTVARLGAEVVVTAPLGLFVGLVFDTGTHRRVAATLTYGLLLGFAIEGGQLLLASGVTQGASILTRVAGLYIGLRLASGLREDRYLTVPLFVAPVVVASIVPYLLVLMYLNGWFQGTWLGFDEALGTISGKMFIPFYFHYYSTETRAVISTLANVGMYSPIGVGIWLWYSARGKQHFNAAIPVWIGAGCACIIEAGKVFVDNKHPDPTNVLIAAIAAALAYWAISWLSRNYGAERGPEPPPLVSVTASPQTVARGSVKPFGWVLAAPAFCLAGYAVTIYPVGAAWLAVALATYAVVLWRYPLVWLFVVPALLPVFDFATWTGWFFFDEFDLVLLVTLAVLCIRYGILPNSRNLPLPVACFFALFLIAYLVSTVRGLLPFQSLDANAFSHYYSHYNALRVAKGVIWPMVFVPFLAKALEDSDALKKCLLPGLLTGLAATTLLAVWERWLFPGFFNFSSDYRATAFLSSMHTGGSSIDAYFALCLPFVAACFLIWRSTTAYMVGLVLFSLGLYAFLTTFSRIDYLAFVIAGVIILVGLLRNPKLETRFFAVALPLAVITALVVVPVFMAPYIYVRFNSLPADAKTRFDHWREVYLLRPGNPMTSLFGAGIGSFPRSYFWEDPGPSRPATFSYETEAGNNFLRLGSGHPVYIVQRLRIPPNSRYRVTLDARMSSGESALGIVICEKSLLYSMGCVSKRIRLEAGDSNWKTFGGEIDLLGLGRRGRPISLALYNARAGGPVIDIDNIQLGDSQGRHFIANGDFENGSDRWFFTSDDHLSWHIKNFWLNLLFEQGWIGLLLTAFLVLFAIMRLITSARHNDGLAIILLASICSGLTVGLTDSLVDAPRIAILFYLLACLSFLYTNNSKSRTPPPIVAPTSPFA